MDMIRRGEWLTVRSRVMAFCHGVAVVVVRQGVEK